MCYEFQTFVSLLLSTYSGKRMSFWSHTWETDRLAKVIWSQALNFTVVLYKIEYSNFYVIAVLLENDEGIFWTSSIFECCKIHASQFSWKIVEMVTEKSLALAKSSLKCIFSRIESRLADISAHWRHNQKSFMNAFFLCSANTMRKWKLA